VLYSNVDPFSNNYKGIQMEDRRKFKRIPVQVSARYLWASKEEWINCSVTNVSREGMGIDVILQERMHPGEILQFKITVPTKEEPIKISGTLTWVKELEGKAGYIGGITFFNMDSEETWGLLDYANKNWKGEGKE
jgi:hypothetical protein